MKIDRKNPVYVGPNISFDFYDFELDRFVWGQ